MLGAFANAFRTPDLRRKLLFVLLIITIFRLGSQVPAPGVNVTNVRACFQQVSNEGIYGLINLFSGGALLQLTIFALGIMPYITASIILQLLVVVIPRLERLKEEGQAGQTKITQYTRYLTLALAILQATGISALARSRNLIQGCDQPLLYNEQALSTMVIMVITMTAGTAVIMWLGELITEHGIGNGMSLLIFTQVVATFPTSLWAVKTANGWLTFAIVLAVGLVVVAAVIFMEQAQRRIPVQYARRMVGRKMFGGSSTYIPLKVNQAGVIPVIFASSLLYLPTMASQFAGQGSWLNSIVQAYFVRGDHPIYMAVYFALIIFFTYFYVAITFNPAEVADNMKKYGGFIPGIRAGKPTEEYLSYVLSRITAPGSLYLGLVSLIPLIAFGLVGANQNFPFGGTSILIMVGVALDTVKQIESQLQQRNYEGFLR
ncbi:MAG TPA: preprotein translocase subunit SecY [Nocardioidaceae bacterium]